MDFLDLDDDGQPDSGPTGNENGGRASYIHYAEPFPTILGSTTQPAHTTSLINNEWGYYDNQRCYRRSRPSCYGRSVVKNSEHSHVQTWPGGTGIIYLLDTTEYTMEDGQFKFKPKLIRDWNPSILLRPPSKF